MSTSKKILITRPEPKAQELAQELKEAGYASLIASLLEISTVDFELPDLDQVQGFIFTSAKALPLLAEKTQKRDMPIYTVGRNTEKVARDLGFTDIRCAHGAAKDLVRLLKKSLAQASDQEGVVAEAKPFIHLRGRHVSYDISRKVKKADIAVEQLIVYEAQQAQTLPDTIIAAFKGGEIEAVTFFSRRSVETFIYLAKKYDFIDALSSIKSLSISPSVLECAGDFWGETYSAQTPDGEGMKALVEEYCTRS